MNTPLLELFQLGGKKNYEFHYRITEEKVNKLFVDHNNNIIDGTIGDPESEILIGQIEEIKGQLK